MHFPDVCTLGRGLTVEVGVVLTYLGMPSAVYCDCPQLNTSQRHPLKTSISDQVQTFVLPILAKTIAQRLVSAFDYVVPQVAIKLIAQDLW